MWSWGREEEEMWPWGREGKAIWAKEALELSFMEAGNLSVFLERERECVCVCVRACACALRNVKRVVESERNNKKVRKLII